MDGNPALTSVPRDWLRVRVGRRARLAVWTSGAIRSSRVAGTSFATFAGVLHLFHLGPLPRSRRRTWLVGAIDEFGGFLPPVADRTLDRALKRMVEGHEGEEMSLEPALAAFAPGLGVPVGPRPGYLEDAPAVLAFSTVNAHESLPMGTFIREFLQACLDYGSVGPWERYRADQPFPVRILARNKTTTREAIVTGAQGEPRGLALYDKPGDALRGVAALRRGEVRAAQRCDATALVFEAKPEWALQAVHTAYSLPEFPFVFRTRGGSLRPASEAELGALTAALTAITVLVADPPAPGKPVEAVLDIDGYEYRAVASPPGPPPMPEAPPRPPESPDGRGEPGAAPRGPRLLPVPRREDMN